MLKLRRDVRDTRHLHQTSKFERRLSSGHVAARVRNDIPQRRVDVEATPARAATRVREETQMKDFLMVYLISFSTSFVMGSVALYAFIVWLKRLGR
jgi:hypothetical protein